MKFLISPNRSIPASTATAERPFSVLHRLKNYLRSSMGQAQLNHVMLFYIYKEQTNKLDIEAVVKEFISMNDRSIEYFGKV